MTATLTYACPRELCPYWDGHTHDCYCLTLDVDPRLGGTEDDRPD